MKRIKHWHSKTKLLLGVLGVVILVGIGTLIWASVTGKLKSSADSVILPYGDSIISGVVKDDSGSQVAVLVAAYNISDGSGGSTKSGPDGRYSIGGVANGTYSVIARDLCASSVNKSVVLQNTINVDLVLNAESAAIVEGSVKDVGGFPIQSATVKIVDPLRDGVNLKNEDENFSDITDYQGRYEIGFGILEGSRHFIVTANGYKTVDTRVNVQVSKPGSSGECRAVVNVFLMQRAYGYIEGNISFQNMNPVNSGLIVTKIIDADNGIQLYPNSNGSYVPQSISRVGNQYKIKIIAGKLKVTGTLGRYNKSIVQTFEVKENETTTINWAF